MARRRRAREDISRNSGPNGPPPIGGRLRPLRDHDAGAIVDAAFSILERIGMADCPRDLADMARARGASQRDDGRLCFPRVMVERALSRAAKTVNLPGYEDALGITVGGGRVHIGTGGAAVRVLDGETSAYRDSTLRDLYGLMTLVGLAENAHYGIRPVIARDMPTAHALDINTAFACLKACPKPIGVSFDHPDHVGEIIRLFELALGGGRKFSAWPFCFAVIVHAVSPLRFSPEGIRCLANAIQGGMPLQICTAGQAGATSPVTLSGALAQGLAEALAGLVMVDVIKPGFPCIFALMPFISDLRTGAMSGGGGEAAIASAAAAQLLLGLGLPSTVSAGMTDAKIADAQAGYEKGYTVALAAQAGADMINLSVGMLGSIMVASPEALLIDDDMCGAILRSVRGVEIMEGGIDLERMEAVVTGDGHYLGEAQTLAMMQTEYVHPRLGDRQGLSDWRDAGAKTIWDRACDKVRALYEEKPGHLPLERENAIRSAFEIHLPEGV
jgi:trimethylamine--corrinoid protein Co-methyltransferase